MSLLLFSGLFAVIAYILIVRSIFRGVRMNLATWAVWSGVNSVATASIIASGFSHPWMNIVFTTGAFVILAISLFRGRWMWGRVETVCSVLAVIAMVLWHYLGSNAAVVASSSAMVIGSIPQLRDTYRDASGQSATSWILFFGSCLLSIVGAPANDIAHLFYPAVALSVNGLMAYFILRKRRRSGWA